MDTSIQLKNSRVKYLDIAKGIAIISIILGHFGIYLIYRVAFTFHVPLFFIISGYFINPKTNFLTFVMKKARSLLIPYYVVCIFMIIIGGLKGLFSGNFLLNIYDWTYSTLYAVGDSFNIPFQIKPIGAIWFLWALFWGTCFVRLTTSMNRIWRMIFLFILILFGYYSIRWVCLPLSLQVGAFTSLYIYIGFIWHKYESNLDRISKNIKSIILIIAIWCWAFFIYSFETFWLVRCDIGRGIFDLFSSLCASFIVIYLSYLLEKKDNIIVNTLAYFGKFSLLVLCIHILELNLFPWYQVRKAIKVELYQDIIIYSGKLFIDLCGAYFLSKIKLVKKVFGYKIDY